MAIPVETSLLSPGASSSGSSRQAREAAQHLLARLAPDHALQVAHKRRKGRRARRGADQVVRGAHVGDPVAHGFVDGIFKRALPRIHAAHLRSQQPHAENVQFLPAHVFRAHVNDALKSKQGTDRRCGDAVLPRARLGDDAVLAHALCQQGLPQAVVDLVRARVQQVFAL